MTAPHGLTAAGCFCAPHNGQAVLSTSPGFREAYLFLPKLPTDIPAR